MTPSLTRKEYRYRYIDLDIYIYILQQSQHLSLYIPMFKHYPLSHLLQLLQSTPAQTTHGYMVHKACISFGIGYNTKYHNIYRCTKGFPFGYVTLSF